MDKIKYLMDRFNTKHRKKMNRELQEEELRRWYKKETHETLDFDNIANFNQYIQYLKMNDNKDYKRMMSDKYLMRNYVKEHLGEKYLPKLYGVYDNANEIDFDKLPDSFVLKCNHGSGMNVIVKNKREINYHKICKQLNKWLKENFAFNHSGLELQYKDIKPKIICEEYLGGDLIDLQLWCSHGNVIFISYIRSPHGVNEKASFDTKWNELDFVTSLPKLKDKVQKPEKLNEAITIAKKVSKEMNFIRMDFYILKDGSLKISEFTFTPARGIVGWTPKSANEMIYQKILSSR